MNKHDIEWAVRVLNEHKHSYCDDWRVERAFVFGCDASRFASYRLSYFEAIAIAKEYERRASRDMPATRKLLDVQKQFIKDMEAANLDDDLVVTRNAAGKFSLGDLRAFIAEWNNQPQAKSGGRPLSMTAEEVAKFFNERHRTDCPESEAEWIAGEDCIKLVNREDGRLLEAYSLRCAVEVMNELKEAGQ